jgi:mannose-6-phosphate isomerase-like protein (cupin superfamily)
VSVKLPASLPEFRVRQPCKSRTCTFSVPADVKVAGVSKVAGQVTEPASMLGLGLDPKTKIATRSNTALAAIAVVLSGEAVAEAGMGKGKPSVKHAMKPLDGVFVDGGDFSITSDTGAQLVVALIGTMKDDGSVLYNGGYWTERPGGEKGFAPFALGRDVLHWAGGKFGASIGFEGPRASCTLLAIEATGGVPPHQHDNEWEMLAILAGRGTTPLGSAENRTNLTAQPGILMSIPKATEHALMPEELPLVAIQFYVPPGPEQRFKKLAGR